MRILFRYLRHQWRAVSAALGFAVVNQVFLMADPLIFRRIIDDYVVQSQRRTRADFFLGVGLWLAAMIAAVFVAWVAKNLQSDQVSRVSHKVSAAMFADGIRHSLELPFAEFEQRRSGETLDRLQKLRWSVERFLVTAVNNLFTTLVGVVFVIVYAGTIHWAIAPSLLVLAGLLSALSILLGRKIKEVQERVLAEGASLAGGATETIRNIELVKSLGLAQQEISRLHKSGDRVLSFELEKARRNRTLTFYHGACVHALRLLLLLLLLYLFFSRQITVGQFFSLYLYSAFIFSPLQEMGWVISQYREMEVSLEGFQDLLASPSEPSSAKAALVGKLDTLEFDCVSFQYAVANRPAIANLSFRVAQGETIAFVGPSGSGKTTLVKLVSGLYGPTGGRILYNGLPQQDVDLNRLRERIGLVTQDTQLFSGSIRENLLFVRPDATDEGCLLALRQAAAHAMLRRAGRGLDTVIGESGIRLSGGEKQRLAIARALLRQPDLLIFDEATSSLDSITEGDISETIREIACAANTITILIAHRLSTVSHADRIYVLDEGRIVQVGRHPELLATKGLYQDLWSQQIGDGPERGSPDSRPGLYSPTC